MSVNHVGVGVLADAMAVDSEASEDAVSQCLALARNRHNVLRSKVYHAST